MHHGVSRGRYGKLAGQRSNSPLSEDTPAPDRLVKPKRNSTSPKSTGDNAVRTMTGITVDDDGAWSCTKTYRHVPGVHTLKFLDYKARSSRYCQLCYATKIYTDPKKKSHGKPVKNKSSIVLCTFCEHVLCTECWENWHKK